MSLPLIPYTALIRWANGLLDAGESLDPAATKTHAIDGDLHDWLRSQFPDHGDPTDGWCGFDPISRLQFEQMTSRLAAGMNPAKYYAVENNGLCLLIAYATQAIQELDVAQPIGSDDP